MPLILSLSNARDISIPSKIFDNRGGFPFMEINLNNVRLLVESTPGMGDLIMLTPALRELKNQFPECEITIMSHPGN